MDLIEYTAAEWRAYRTARDEWQTIGINSPGQRAAWDAMTAAWNAYQAKADAYYQTLPRVNAGGSQ